MAQDIEDAKGMDPVEETKEEPMKVVIDLFPQVKEENLDLRVDAKTLFIK